MKRYSGIEILNMISKDKLHDNYKIQRIDDETVFNLNEFKKLKIEDILKDNFYILVSYKLKMKLEDNWITVAEFKNISKDSYDIITKLDFTNQLIINLLSKLDQNTKDVIKNLL